MPYADREMIDFARANNRRMQSGTSLLGLQLVKFFGGRPTPPRRGRYSGQWPGMASGARIIYSSIKMPNIKLGTQTLCLHDMSERRLRNAAILQALCARK